MSQALTTVAPETVEPEAVATEPKARKAFKTGPRTCMECGATFRGGHPKALFCSAQHQADFHNRSAKLGRVIMPLAKAWRQSRGKTDEASKQLAREAFAMFCRMLDEASADDRTAGRPAALQYVRAKDQMFGLDARRS